MSVFGLHVYQVPLKRTQSEGITFQNKSLDSVIWYGSSAHSNEQMGQVHRGLIEISVKM